jgi:hypothetical protein
MGGNELNFLPLAGLMTWFLTIYPRLPSHGTRLGFLLSHKLKTCYVIYTSNVAYRVCGLLSSPYMSIVIAKGLQFYHSHRNSLCMQVRLLKWHTPLGLGVWWPSHTLSGNMATQVPPSPPQRSMMGPQIPPSSSKSMALLSLLSLRMKMWWRSTFYD